MQVNIRRIRDAKGASLTARGEMNLNPVLGQGLRADGPAAVEATVTNAGRFLHAEGRVRVQLRGECVRCLMPVNFVLTTPFTEDYFPEGRPLPAEETEAEFGVYAGDVVDLAPAVTEAVLLALPMRLLCREDCPGLCPACGHNLAEGRCACRPEGGGRGLEGLARFLPKKEV
ncbi:MAG: YceD family protein [Bacteroidota bacterium]